ncbi:MAG: hypothetical protein DWG80_05915 [Chloroflexi bacterium]|nr:hypothetical protein [Chloroflexota bacterium]
MRHHVSYVSARLRASLALRLMVPLLVALIPLALLARHQAEENRDRTVTQARVAMDTAASALAQSERTVIGDAGAIISSLSELPSVRAGGAACTETVQAVTDIDRRFANLGVIDARGNVICSALPAPPGVTLGDRTYFIDAMRYNDLAWGSYQFGRITGEPTVNAGYPIRDDHGRPIGVMFGAVRVAFLGEQLRMVDLPDEASALVVDHAGTILVDTAHTVRVGDPAYQLSLSYLMSNPQLALGGLFEGEVLTSVRELTGGLVVVVLPRASVVAPAEREARTVLIAGIAAAAVGHRRDDRCARLQRGATASLRVRGPTNRAAEPPGPPPADPLVADRRPGLRATRLDRRRRLDAGVRGGGRGDPLGRAAT